jgi:hypothetical protein
LIITLADDLKAVASVDRRHAVRFQIGEQKPGDAFALVGGNGNRTVPNEHERRSARPRSQKCAPLHFIAP